MHDGSIKLTTIDGVITDKKIYIDKKWRDACKMDKCNKLLYRKELCEHHYETLYEGAERGEIRIITGKKMKWDGTKWECVCSAKSCKKISVLGKTMCKQHVENPNVFYSPFQDSLSIFNDIMEDYSKNKNKRK